MNWIRCITVEGGNPKRQWLKKKVEVMVSRERKREEVKANKKIKNKRLGEMNSL